MLSARTNLFVGEAPERVGHHLEVGVEVAGSTAGPGGLFAEFGKEGGRPELPNERHRRIEGTRLEAPLALPAEDTGGDVEGRIGNERTRQACFERALVAVVDDGAGVLDCGGGVGQVVGNLLIGLDDGVDAPALCG